MASKEELENRLVHNLLVPPPQDLYQFDRNLDYGEVARLMLGKLFQIAARARGLGDSGGGATSYRDCDVYAAGLILSELDPLVSVVYGYNIKLGSGDTPNIHAEDMILAQLKMIGGYLLGLVVSGPLQPDDGTLRRPVALLPCSARCASNITTHEGGGAFTTVSGIDPLNGSTALASIDGLNRYYEGEDTIYEVSVPGGIGTEDLWRSLTSSWIVGRSQQCSRSLNEKILANVGANILNERSLTTVAEPTSSILEGERSSFAESSAYRQPHGFRVRPSIIELARDADNLYVLSHPSRNPDLLDLAS